MAETAPCYALSFSAREAIETERVPDTIADCVACRVPAQESRGVILDGVSRVLSVTEAEIRVAMKRALGDTHQMAEGGGALPIAAVLMDIADDPAGFEVKCVVVILTGGIVDQVLLCRVIASQDLK